MPSSNIQTTILPAGVWVVSLSGEHDLATAQELSEALLLVPGQSQLIVDITEAEFIDSTTLAAMLRARGRNGSAATPIAVAVRPGSVPERVFRLSGADRNLRTFPSLDEAVARLSASQG
jgi:anti-anti-sigma factor